MELGDQLVLVWDFIKVWAFLPASAVILIIVRFIKDSRISLGKLNFIYALIFGLFFSLIQFYVAEPLGYTPLQTEFIPMVVMGICTGFVATGIHTILKNTNQARKGE